jgi:hypothetical protein
MPCRFTFYIYVCVQLLYLQTYLYICIYCRKCWLLLAAANFRTAQPECITSENGHVLLLGGGNSDACVDTDLLNRC